MKIGVFGNCQSTGIARSLSVLLPEAEIHRFGLGSARTANADIISAQIEEFASCDYVFTQPPAIHKIGGFQTDELIDRCKTVIPYPTIICRSLHPDCHYLAAEGGLLVQGPMGTYQSGIAAGAYLSGLSIDRAVALFNSFTYRKLGFLEIDPNDEGIGLEAQRFGYDFGVFISGERGRFMHTINHPVAGILFEAARQGLDKVGVSYNDANELPHDALANRQVWPIYAGIAKNIVAGDSEVRFRFADEDVDLSLPEFIEASYAAFREVNGAFGSKLATKVKEFISAHVL